MLKRCLAVFMALVLSCSVMIKPINAQAAEARMLGSGLAAMGVSLSVPQIALLLAAAGGAVFLYENREEVGESLQNFLESASEGVSEKIEQLESWYEAARVGNIIIGTGQEWLKDAIKEWIGGLYNGNTLPYVSATDTDYRGNPIYPNDTPLDHSMGWDVTLDLNDNYLTVKYGRLYRYIDIASLSPNYAHINILYVIAPSTKASAYCTLNNNEYTMEEIQVIARDGVQRKAKSITVPIHAVGKDAVSDLVELLQGSRQFNPNSYSNGVLDIRIAEQTELFTAVAVPQTVGGIDTVLDDGYTMDDIHFDDLEFVGYGYISADTTKTGEEVFEESITNTLTGMQAGTITWTDYVTDVSTAPTITIPDATDQTITNDYVIGDTGITDVVVTPGVIPDVNAPNLDNYKVQLKDFFPFCLPFDIVDFIGVLAAEPEAPKMEITFPWIEGEGFKFNVDLSVFDPVAEILRAMELLALIVGLGFKTRNMIRG